MDFDRETEILTAIGPADEITINELKAEVLNVLKSGMLKQEELLGRVTAKNQLVLKAIIELCEEFKVNRTGSGKRGDPYLYSLI